MMDLIRFLIREPVLGGVVFLCVALVLGLILSGQAEKRRTRELLRAREAARQAMLRGNSAGVSVPAPAGGEVFRIFRWEFAVLSIIVIAFVYPTGSEENTPVSAREPQVSAAPAVQEEKRVEPIVTASAESAGQKSSTTGGGGLNPDALFQFDTTSDLADDRRSVLAPEPGNAGFSLPNHGSRSRLSRR